MQYIGIRSEGGLIPYDILDNIANEQAGLGQQAKDFGLPAGRRLTDEIARAWSDAQDYWHIFQRRSASLPEPETGTTLTRKWITDLLNDLLGYDLTYQPSGAVVLGKNYPISHRAGAGEESPPVNIEGLRIDLDRRPQGRRLSPQALVQEYLNNSEAHLWGIVTNGTLLRLLRDTSRTSRPTYLEFDLQSILDGNRFNEFALFYRVCHRSRLPKTAEDSTSCWLEKYFQLSIEQGGRVRDKLRDGVEDVLKLLGTGILRHPSNQALRERVKSGALPAAEFHRQLLRLVYRLLFLMVAEERRMIVPEAPDSERRQHLYDSYYSIGRLRTLAEKYIEPSTFGDLWIGLQQTFALFEDRADFNPLGIPPLNGALFSDIAVKDLQGTHLYNDELLAAIMRLSLFEDRRVLQRVNYGALDVEELGSIYESLLDYQPVCIGDADGMRFDLRVGSERKSTGSYYTRPELVRELIESALVPVMQDRLAAANDADAARQKDKQQQAILSMTVCDPACGSGHFLLAAARRLGRELAKVRTGEDEPTPREFHLAVRDVIAHCIYGVDLNPLAVDLCKLALWLEGHWTGKPLSFLDHRVKLGNSLVGVLDPKVLEDGIPNEAFTAVTGDDKEVAKAFKKRNREERKGQPSLPFDAVQHAHEYATEYQKMTGIAEDTSAGVREKARSYQQWRSRPDWWHVWTACNIWTSAFFAPLTKFDDPTVPTHELFLRFVQRQDGQAQMAGAANALAEQLRFFHWQFEFPEVFERDGFDVLLGNPPWEKLKLMQVEFFAARAPEIADTTTQAQRHKLIDRLKSSRPRLFQEWQDALTNIERGNRFIRFSSRFSYSAVGELNTYALFSELALRLCRPKGRSGMIVKSSLITADTYGEFFKHIAHNHLISAFDFKNWALYFADVGFHERYTLLTMEKNRKKGEAFRIGVELVYVEDITNAAKTYTITSDELNLFSPHSGTCPLFRNTREKELASYVYNRFPVLVSSEPINNPWRLKYTTLFHMSADSNLFKTKTELSGEGAQLGGYFHGEDRIYDPPYEGKYFHLFNHRFASYEGIPDEARFTRKASTNTPNLKQLQDPDYEIEPRYWIKHDVVRKTVERQIRPRDYYVLARLVTNVISNNRTTIACIAPAVACNNLALILYLDESDKRAYATKSLLFVSLLNSFAFDFMARLKVSENLLKSTLFEISAPEPAIAKCPLLRETVENFVVPRAAELSCTTWSLTPLLRDLGLECRPFRWDEDRRFLLRCELDAAFFHIYLPSDKDGHWVSTGSGAAHLAGLKASCATPRDAVLYMMDTFPIVARRDEEKFGEYRTKRTILEIYDSIAQSMHSDQQYRTRLTPPPADPRCWHFKG